MKKIAVCLLSGGLDSCVAATLKKKDGFDLYLLSIDWGQTFSIELESAKRISKTLQPVDHKFLELKGYEQLSQSALTAHHEIPKKGSIENDSKIIPVTYPPGRDPTYIFIAMSWLESIVLKYLSENVVIADARVVIGTNMDDSRVYPDCKKEVYRLINQMLAISTKVGQEHHIPLEVDTPLINFSKKDVIKKGYEIQAPVHMTYSCYTGDKIPCGECYTCRIIFFGFKDLGIENPFKYKKIPKERYV